MKKSMLWLTIRIALLIPITALAISLFPNTHSTAFDQQAHEEGLNPKVLHLAMNAYDCAHVHGIGTKNPKLTIVDYSLPSTQKRLWVLDMKDHTILYHTYVTHGKGSGHTMATRFSNQDGTKESSLGLFLTQNQYVGHDGFSMRIEGLEKGFNNNAKSRNIVFHGGWYASGDVIKRYGTLGRSWGCFAVDKKLVHPMIHTIENGSLIFAYYPDAKWLHQSKFLGCHAESDIATQT